MEKAKSTSPQSFTQKEIKIHLKNLEILIKIKFRPNFGLNPIHDGLFLGLLTDGGPGHQGKKALSLKSVTHVLQ